MYTLGQILYRVLLICPKAFWQFVPASIALIECHTLSFVSVLSGNASVRFCFSVICLLKFSTNLESLKPRAFAFFYKKTVFLKRWVGKHLCNSITIFWYSHEVKKHEHNPVGKHKVLIDKLYMQWRTKLEWSRGQTLAAEVEQYESCRNANAIRLPDSQMLSTLHGTSAQMRSC